MGNCLKGSTTDDISLLPGSDSARELSPEQLVAAAAALSNAIAPPIYSEVMNYQQNLQQHNPSSQQQQQIFYPTPSSGCTAANLSEEEQIKIAKRIGLIQHLPIGAYDAGGNNNGGSNNGGSSTIKECVICMIEFSFGDKIRYLPCMHIYHVKCVDDWLMRSLCCPSCMEPVDAALLVSYDQAGG